MPSSRNYIGRAAALLLLPVLTACGHQTRLAETDTAPSARLQQDVRTHQGLDATLWMQTSAEFQAAAWQNFLFASLRLEQALEDPGWTAALEQDGAEVADLPPAIIVDIDETIIDNSPYQAFLVTEGLTYEPISWDRWVRRSEAVALKGAREFLNRAESLGVTVFYVTNRDAEHEPATRRNLERERMPIDSSRDVVLMKGEHGWDSDKTSRRRFIAESHRILLLLGDDLNDFVSAKEPAPEPRLALAEQHRDLWGTKWFLFANPGYGSWEQSLFGMDYSLSQEEKQRLKSRHLRPVEF
ncbi:MAG: HAD family acid phosphatase [Acidobacteriota bacterium]